MRSTHGVSAGVGGGVELFAYVPRSVYPYLRELTNQDYVHRYFVDGPVVEGDVYLGGAWKNVVVGSTGAGPAGLFALDVTRPESFAANKVLWDITPTEEPDLGKVMGASFIGSVKTGATTGKWVAIVPNGYQSANNRAVLLIIDVQTGQTLRKIDTCKKNTGVSFGPAEQGARCDPANQNGLSNVSVVFDGNRNVTGVYAGDYQGNLWKFDLSSTNPADWKIATEDPVDASGNTPAPMFTAVNGSGEAQAITAAPRASVHPNGGFYVVFGTGKLFEFVDQTDTRVQTIYGLWDKPGDKAPIGKASLRGLGLTQATVGTVVQRELTNLAGFNWQSQRGWYFDLVASGFTPGGEKVIADPELDVGVVRIASFQPAVANDPCEGGGTSFLYSIPVGHFLEPIVGRAIPGSVSSPTLIGTETAPVGQRRTTLGQGDVATMTPKYQRSGTGFSATDPVRNCAALFQRTNTFTGHVPQQCAGYYPLRTWRPIR